jgi:histidine triad (HIT) family protein
MTQTSCLFCKIVAGEAAADIVLESEDVVAFRDINPAGPSHILVIPRRHIASLEDLTADDGPLLAALFGAVNQLAVKDGLSGGYRVVSNVGEDAGQSVHHLHLHLIGGRSMSWPPG